MGGALAMGLRTFGLRTNASYLVEPVRNGAFLHASPPGNGCRSVMIIVEIEIEIEIEIGIEKIEKIDKIEGIDSCLICMALGSLSTDQTVLPGAKIRLRYPVSCFR